MDSMDSPPFFFKFFWNFYLKLLGAEVGQFGQAIRSFHSLDPMNDRSKRSIEKTSSFTFEKDLVKTAVESNILHQILLQYTIDKIYKNDADFVRIALDFAKKSYFKRIKSTTKKAKKLCDALKYFFLKNTKFFWFEFSRFCDHVSVAGNVPLSRCTSSSHMVSVHPYRPNSTAHFSWINPGASSVTLQFDRNCHLEQNHDFITLTAFNKVGSMY